MGRSDPDPHFGVGSGSTTLLERNPKNLIRAFFVKQYQCGSVLLSPVIRLDNTTIWKKRELFCAAYPNIHFLTTRKVNFRAKSIVLHS